MTITVAPTQRDANTALRAFVLSLLPGIECIRGQVNRVPEPRVPDFVVTWPIIRGRVATNVDSYDDCRFTASIAGTVMSVSNVSFGIIEVGARVFGSGLSGTVLVTGTLSGTGGTGTYSVSPAQALSSRVLATGVMNSAQSTELTIQMDVHGPASADNAQILSTMLRDDYANLAFQRAGFPNVTTLYASDPRQVPFINAESQYEDRWIVEAHLHVYAIVSDIPQEFMDQAVIDPIILSDALPLE